MSSQTAAFPVNSPGELPVCLLRLPRSPASALTPLAAHKPLSGGKFQLQRLRASYTTTTAPATQWPSSRLLPPFSTVFDHAWRLQARCTCPSSERNSHLGTTLEPRVENSMRIMSSGGYTNMADARGHCSAPSPERQLLRCCASSIEIVCVCFTVLQQVLHGQPT